MLATETRNDLDLLSAILSEESFHPTEPRTLEEAGLPGSLVDGRILKYLAVVGNASGRAIADQVCLSFGILEGRYQRLRSRQLLTHRGAAPLSDHVYALTDQGREQAQRLF